MVRPRSSYYRRAMETGEACSLRDLLEPSGVWVEVRAYPSEDGLSVYFHDISFKHQAEQALKKSEQRFRNLFQQAADSIVIADRDLFIVAANGRACSNFGYTEEEFLRLRVPDIDSGFTPIRRNLPARWTMARPSSCASRNGARTAAPSRPTSTSRASRTTATSFSRPSSATSPSAKKPRTACANWPPTTR